MVKSLVWYDFVVMIKADKFLLTDAIYIINKKFKLISVN